jgi:hypothetical protein
MHPRVDQYPTDLGVEECRPDRGIDGLTLPDAGRQRQSFVDPTVS